MAKMIGHPGTAAARTRTVRHLRELIAALDRRVPLARAGEQAIADDAAALRSKALDRIRELEREV
jgi:hypothetical protein